MLNASSLVELGRHDSVYSGVLRCGVWTIKMKDELKSWSMYHLIINSKQNKVTPYLAWLIFHTKDHNGKIVGDVCLLQYNTTNESQNVEVDVEYHGNSRKFNPAPFYPMKRSSL